MPITLNGDTGITTPTYNGSVTAEYSVPVTAFKNRIINGDMRIDQRNAGASFTASGGYTLDRWNFAASQASKFTGQQNQGSVTPPVGFTKYLGFTSSSAYSSLATDYFLVEQPIEGLNVADLGFGTANASTVTLSFWVRSSLTGTFSGALGNSGASRGYAFTFSIPVANTWTQISITIAGDTTGTWLTTNGVGLSVKFNLGTGSNRLVTAGSWQSADIVGATGSVSVVGTNGATFYITGVQLEKGSTATSFDYRPYGTELALCQRYYSKSFNVETAPAQNIGTVGAVYVAQSGGASANQTSNARGIFPVTMRATPTITTYNPNAANQYAYSDSTGSSWTTINIVNQGSSGFGWYGTSPSGSSSGNGCLLHWSASAEL